MKLSEAILEHHQPTYIRCPIALLLGAFSNAQRDDLLAVLGDKHKYPAVDVELGLTKIGHHLGHIGAPAVRNHRNGRCSCAK